MIRHPTSACAYCGGRAGVHLGDCPVTRQHAYPDIPQPIVQAAAPNQRRSDVEAAVRFAGQWVANFAAIFLGTFFAGLLLLLLTYAWARWKVDEFTRNIPILNAPRLDQQQKVDAVKGAKK